MARNWLCRPAKPWTQKKIHLPLPLPLPMPLPMPLPLPPHAEIKGVLGALAREHYCVSLKTLWTWAKEWGGERMITFLKIKARPLFGPVYFTQISCYWLFQKYYILSSCHLLCSVWDISNTWYWQNYRWLILVVSNFQNYISFMEAKLIPET